MLDLKLPLYIDGNRRLRTADQQLVEDYDLEAINGILAAQQAPAVIGRSQRDEAIEIAQRWKNEPITSFNPGHSFGVLSRALLEYRDLYETLRYTVEHPPAGDHGEGT